MWANRIPLNFAWIRRNRRLCSGEHEIERRRFGCERTHRFTKDDSLNNSRGRTARANTAWRRRFATLFGLEMQALRPCEAFHKASSKRSRIAMPEVQRRCIPKMLRVSRVRTKRRAPQKEQAFHHNVYVILLRDAVAKHPSILRLNPRRDPLKPCVYVGMTGLPVDHRFENHKNGYK
jgi:hypothetical protein